MSKFASIGVLCRSRVNRVGATALPHVALRLIREGGGARHGRALAYIVGWPAWSGYGIVAVVLFIAAFLLVRYRRGRLSRVRALPKTTETLKENLAWMQSKSVER